MPPSLLPSSASVGLSQRFPIPCHLFWFISGTQRARRPLALLRSLFASAPRAASRKQRMLIVHCHQNRPRAAEPPSVLKRSESGNRLGTDWERRGREEFPLPVSSLQSDRWTTSTRRAKRVRRFIRTRTVGLQECWVFRFFPNSFCRSRDDGQNRCWKSAQHVKASNLHPRRSCRTSLDGIVPEAAVG